MTRFSFRKEERLKSKKIIAELMKPPRPPMVIGGVTNTQASGNKNKPAISKTKETASGWLGGTEFFPLRVLWIETEFPGKFPARVLFSVPKKKIKSAVQRNRIKRRMCEAYRKNKHILYEKLNISNRRIALAFIYTSQEESEYPEIERKIFLSLQRLTG